MSDDTDGRRVIDRGQARFELGRIVATPGALAAFERNGADGRAQLTRHVRGDWGDVDEDDQATNERSVKGGSSIQSVYHLDDGTEVWVITEADRSMTTFLLPEER
jgi:hypothetical protein